jgi:hypothetical protein
VQDGWDFILEKNNAGVLKVLNLTTPLGTKGWLGHPHGAKGVAGTTPMLIGVVLATTWCPSGPPEVFFFFSFFSSHFFFFWKKIFCFLIFFLNSSKKFN